MLTCFFFQRFCISPFYFVYIGTTLRVSVTNNWNVVWWKLDCENLFPCDDLLSQMSEIFGFYQMDLYYNLFTHLLCQRYLFPSFSLRTLSPTGHWTYDLSQAYSTLFVFSNKNKDWQPVTDLFHLNQLLSFPRLIVKLFPIFKLVFTPDTWMNKTEVTNTFLLIPVDLQSWPYFSFAHQEMSY